MKGRAITACAVLIVMVLSLAATFVFPVKTAYGSDDLTQKLSELDRLTKEIEEYKERISQAQTNQKSVLNELAQLENQLALSEKELAYIKASIEYASAEIDQTKAEIAVLEERLAVQKAAFDARLVSMYKAGRTSYVDILLTSRSLSDLMARLHYLKQLAADDTLLIESYTSDRLELVAKKDSLEARLNQLVDLQAAEEEKRLTVVNRSMDREKYLAEIHAEKARLEKALDEMEERSKALEKIIAEAQAAGKLPQRELSMIWPVTGYWITSYYGSRPHPVLGYTRFHSGIDYAADYNVPIKAAESGKVIVAGVDPGGYGNYVIIDHGGGISTLYGHANKLNVKTGDVVVKGQTIALVGSTGISTGPHLHFEVRVNGQTTDPLQWLP
ncbi:MAG: murein hydrolase activator EnvC family protein [Bacillota bacterium]|jgi:murein DD-endopeptidase MepM/ murein hydrolase activator NlpD